MISLEFSLNFWKILHCWYTYQIMFFFLLLMIFWNSLITATASSLCPTLLAFSSRFLFSCWSSLMTNSSSSFFISCFPFRNLFLLLETLSVLKVVIHTISKKLWLFAKESLLKKFAVKNVCNANCFFLGFANSFIVQKIIFWNLMAR